METLTSSVVVVRALGLEPDGVPALAASVCAICGLPIAKGDLCSPAKFSPSFMDDLSLAFQGSKMSCGYCPQVMGTEGLRTTGYGAFSLVDGALPFRKWGDIAAAVTDPPAPPFVMVYATANNQHMAWRAPVNHSREMFYVRVGLRDLRIRRAHLLAAVDHCRILEEARWRKSKIRSTLKNTEALAQMTPVWHCDTQEKAMDAFDQAAHSILKADLWTAKALAKLRQEVFSEKPGKTLANPFIELSPDLKDPGHGKLYPETYSFAKIFPESLKAVLALTAGEVWALRFVLTPGAGQPD